MIETFMVEGSMHRLARCMCDCGREVTKRVNNLRTGHTLSCGCLQKQRTSEAKIQHGMRNTRTYKSWASMRGRVNGNVGTSECYDGIDMDPRWETFLNFYLDMGERPEGKSLDRIDNEKGYWPGNCRWATPKEQSENRRQWGAGSPFKKR